MVTALMRHWLPVTISPLPTSQLLVLLSLGHLYSTFADRRGRHRIDTQSLPAWLTHVDLETCTGLLLQAIAASNTTANPEDAAQEDGTRVADQLAGDEGVETHMPAPDKDSGPSHHEVVTPN